MSGFTSRPLCYDTESAGLLSLISLGTLRSSLSLKEQHLSVNSLPSTTSKLLQVNYYTVSQLFGGVWKIFLKNGFNSSLWYLQEICHVLSLHQDSWCEHLSSLVIFVCVICNFKVNCKAVKKRFKAFLVRLFGISTFVTLATIQILMSPLLNVFAHNSTQCLCLGLQHSAAWCLYSGNYLLFISKGQFVNKPKHL